ncbi:rRNA maturation RNase YbeY [Clostridiaceae bacterium M8S5]|nr:rRNA maturation RNase YbeY [Clostridiaceae bacterium M8S5]
MQLLIDNRQEKIEISQEIIEDIKKVVSECLMLERGNTDYEVSVSFVDNEEIKTLNKMYRNKDSYTDVLSFPIEDDSIFIEGQESMLGDIVISVEKGIAQAKELGHSIKRELMYLTAHSMFHLLGYDHMTETEKEIMRQKEKDVMKNLKIFKSDK